VSGHTPGPWVVRQDSRDRDGLWELVGYDIESEKGCEIVGCEGIEAWKDNAEANARLIAAAPELLAALREALQSLEYVQDKHGEKITGGFKRLDDMGRARRAIAKATGEGP
jgi:hypothetical protein